jgi:hypothetical protein
VQSQYTFYLHKMNKFWLFGTLLIFSFTGIHGQSVSLLFGSSINQNEIFYESTNGATAVSSTSIAPIVGFEIQHSPKVATSWTLKTNNAFDNIAIGELFNYTFHYNELGLKLDVGVVNINHSQFFVSSGASAQILTEARQSLGSFNYNLLEGGFEKSGSSLFFGIGSKGNSTKALSFTTDLRYNLGMTNFEKDSDQVLNMGSVSLNLMLRLNVEAIGKGSDD